MNHKTTIKSILFSFFILLSTLSFSQSNEETLKHLEELTLKMFTDMNNRDYDAILDMTHPKVFEIAPKESMKDLFKSMFEGNEEFSIDIPKTIPKYNISEIFRNDKDSLDYAFVTYDMSMSMTFHKQEFDEEAKKMMRPIMEAKGMEVTFVSNNTMNMLMKDRITIMLKDNHTNNKWVMVNYDPDSPLFYQIVPTSLLESVKAYKQNLMLETKKSKEDN